MKDSKGRPTRLALSARAWGEPVPQNAEDAAALAAKGRRLLERYKNMKKLNDEDIEKENDSSGKELHNDVNYDKVINMEKTLTDNKLSLIKKFINWVVDNSEENLGLEKSDHETETLIEEEVSVEQVEEPEMDIEVLKEALGTVIDQKLTDFAKSFKEEVDASVSAKIEEVAKSVEIQKEELAAKLAATEVALEEQTAKVEQIAHAGAMKKSVDLESDEDSDKIAKSQAKPESFWKNVYLDQGLIESLGYKS
jgi:hypothetical protein